MDTDEVLDLMRSVAAEVITPRFRALAEGEVMEKNPGDLVTVADHESEVLITQALDAAYPQAVVLGEEASAVDPGLVQRFMAADHGFTVDPVDGTKNFVHGSPDHAVMVSEVKGGETVRGWIWQPEHGTAWVAENGAGVFRDGERITRPAVEEGTPPRGATSMWTRRGQALGDLPPLVGSWVCCGIDYPRLIEGAVDYLVYSHSNFWDHLPGTLMAAEAGGAYGHPDGSRYDAHSRPGGLLVASDPATLRTVQAAWPDEGGV
ncbi:inositol monophosphatase family protein [Segeticoccus rhizosphaerae]|uniref:inositol monophosphatase family protein n=1 Tax=Segeticoccus rhizosphaerae TaxID=1104777 RepID=UPI001264B4F7|nr:inositol monophosphatase [Segeticoccus rhizosphaerae]